MARRTENRQEKWLPRIAEPLAVIPRHAPGVAVRETDKGEFHLRKKYPPTRTLMGFLRRRLGWKHECYYNLDARGTEFWKLIDGHRTLQEIAEVVSSRWDVEKEEARTATVLYVRGLMLRNLVELQVPESAIGERRP